MMETAAHYEDGPSALRFPRGEGQGVLLPDEARALAIGKGRIVQDGSDVAILSLGTILDEAQKAATQLSAKGVSVTLADARFAKPFDKDMIAKLVQNHRALLIVEEGSPGGFSAHVLQYLANAGLLSSDCAIRVAPIADAYIDHDSRPGQLAKAGIDAPALVTHIEEMVAIKTPKKKSQE